MGQHPNQADQDHGPVHVPVVVQFDHVHFHSDGRHENIKENTAQLTRTCAFVVTEFGKAQGNPDGCGGHDDPKEALFEAAQELDKAVRIAVKDSTKPRFEGRP